MSSFKERKDQRRQHYEQYVKGWKDIPCTACSGSCYYCGRPCGACCGTGKEKVSPEKYDYLKIHAPYMLKGI